MIRRYTSLHLY